MKQILFLFLVPCFLFGQTPVKNRNVYVDTLHSWLQTSVTAEDTMKFINVPLMPTVNHQGEVGIVSNWWLLGRFDSLYATVPKGGLKDTIDTKKRKDDSTANAGYLPYWWNGKFFRYTDTTALKAQLLKNADSTTLRNYSDALYKAKDDSTNATTGYTTLYQNSLKGTVVLTVASSTSLQRAHADYKCDGTNDEVQIQAAISALPATGGTILMLDGTFNIASSILLSDSSITIAGIGSTTILKLVNGANCDVFHLDDIAHAYPNNARFIVFKDFTIDGNRANQTDSANGIYLKNIGSSKIQNVSVYRCSPYGVNFDQPDNVSGSEWNTIDGCYFEGDSIGLRMNRSDASIITKSTFKSNISHGFVVNGSTNQAQIIDANSSYNGGDGGQINGSIEVSISGGCYANNGDRGLLISTSSSATVSNVLAVENLNAGLKIDNGKNNKIIGGVFRESSVGVFLNNASDYTQLLGMTIEKDVVGIYIINSNGTKIFGGSISGGISASDGIIEVGTSDSTKVINLQIRSDVPTPITFLGAHSNRIDVGTIAAVDSTRIAFLDKANNFGTNAITAVGAITTSGKILQLSTLSINNNSVADFYNISSTGYGAYIQGGDATRYVLDLWNYNGTIEAFKVMGNGNAAFAGTLAVGGGTAIAKVVSVSSTYDCGSIAAGVDSTFSITCTGAVAGNPTSVGVSAAAEAGLVITAECTTNDAVTVRISNHFSVSAVDPASRTYKVMVVNF